MVQPMLPPELHQSIIDIIGDDVVYAEQILHSAKRSARETLRACSLVCKAWHDSALRYTFHNARFSMVVGDINLERHAELFRMLEINPLIKRCIRRTEIYLQRGVLPEHVETLCKAISPIEILRVVLEPSGLDPELRLPRPFPLDGLRPILTTQYLRHFSIWGTHFPLRLLENSTNLRSLTLEGVEMLDTESSRDGAWRSMSSTLEKLVVTRGGRVLTQVGAAVETNVGLYAFFKHVKYLDMDLFGDESLRDSPWRVLLARWIHLETLVFRWAVINMGKFVSIENSVKLFEMCQMIPWESFQGLRSMTYGITFRMKQPQRLSEGEVDPSKTIFSGPSRLPQLQDLRVVHHNQTPSTSKRNLCAPPDFIYLHNLNRTIEDPSSFPCLRTFHTEVKCTVIRRTDRSLALDEDKLAQFVVDRLPAVFGSGGRKETHGWSTSIVPSVRIIT